MGDEFSIIDIGRAGSTTVPTHMSETNDHHGCDKRDSAEYRHEWSAETPTSVAVVEAIASVTGREPTEITPLHEYIDPDALDSLFETSERSGRSPSVVSFPFEDYHVVVRGTGEIIVYPPH